MTFTDVISGTEMIAGGLVSRLARQVKEVLLKSRTPLGSNAGMAALSIPVVGDATGGNKPGATESSTVDHKRCERGHWYLNERPCRLKGLMG